MSTPFDFRGAPIGRFGVLHSEEPRSAPAEFDCSRFTLLGMGILNDELVTAARTALSNAYAPYSGYAVGAALQTADGGVFSGANVENASYGLTLCAERVAVAAAVVAGVREFRELVIVTSGASPAIPCGACRQVLAEFGMNLLVTAVGKSGSQQWRLAELLPYAFGREDLNV